MSVTCLFPTTQVTWIADQMSLGADGVEPLRQHLMQVYYEPLQEYFQCTRSRWMGAPDEVVSEFIVDRLNDDTFEHFVGSWRRSGKRLNEWLRNGLSFYLRKKYQHICRDRRMQALPPTPVRDKGLSPEAAMEAKFRESIVTNALERTQRECEKQGRELHWQIFEHRFLRGERYGDFCAELEVSEESAASLCRTTRKCFREAIRAILIDDGVSKGRVDQALEELLHC